jgi:hypothetical protein
MKYPTPMNAHHKDSGGGRAEFKQNLVGSTSDNKDQTVTMVQKGRTGGSSKNKSLYPK